jgi:fumarate reductase subunit C
MVEVREAVWKRPAGWWAHNRRYALFMFREVGGALSALYGILLLGLLVQHDAGKSAYESYLAFLQMPVMLVIQSIILVFVLIHAFTWFYLIGKSQSVMSSYRAPAWSRILGLMIVVFVGVSVAVLYIVFGGI